MDIEEKIENGKPTKLKYYLEYAGKKYLLKKPLSQSEATELETAFEVIDKYTMKEETFEYGDIQRNKTPFNSSELKEYLDYTTNLQETFFKTLVDKNGKASLEEVAENIWENMSEEQKKGRSKTNQIVAGVLSGLTKIANRDKKEQVYEWDDNIKSYVIKPRYYEDIKKYFRKE
jgi:cytochrome c556